MTDENENRLSDEELEAYLADRHEVSDAYKHLAQESSPQSLDDKILAQARESVTEKTAGIPADNPRQSSGWNYRPYAVAATVFLCLSVSFMFVNRTPVNDSATLTDALERSGNQPARSPSVAADTDLAEAEPRVREEAAPVAANTAVIQGGAQARSPEELLDLVEESRLTENSEQLRRSQAFTDTLADEQNQPAYRNNRESWLAEIQRLLEAGESGQAESEAELLLERFPDTDPETLQE